jgi:hypothetical protein
LQVGNDSPTKFQGVPEILYMIDFNKGEFAKFFSTLSDSDVKKLGGVEKVEHIIKT